MKSQLESVDRRAQQRPVVKSYLKHFRRALLVWNRDRCEIDGIVLEIDNHLAEAVHSGKSVAEVIKSLGPPELLAEAYGVALEFDAGARFGPRWLAGSIRMLSSGARLVASLVWLLLGGLLLVTSALAGLLALLAAIVLPFVPPSALDPTLRFGLPQLVVLVVGVGLLVLAGQLSRWLRVHFRLARGGAKSARSLGDVAQMAREGASLPSGVTRFPQKTNDNLEEVK